MTVSVVNTQFILTYKGMFAIARCMEALLSCLFEW